jgi:acetoacetyl-CoA synthetase
VSVTDEPEILWTPTEADIAQAGVTRFIHWLEQHRGVRLNGAEQLWRWSVSDVESFWGAVWDYFEVLSDEPYREVLATRAMPGARWFAGTRLNYAEHALRYATCERPALLVYAEDAAAREVSWSELRRDVGALAATLREAGVARGDRVCGYLSNIPETIVAMLASVSLGAVWSVCAPDYGIDGVLSRFAQLEPKVLIAVDGYRFAGRPYTRRSEIAELQAALSSVEQTIVVSRAEDRPEASATGTLSWQDAVAREAELCFERVPFDHPLWVLFSSGTTGLPKGLVHSHGGMTLEQLKQSALGHDVRRKDRWFFFSSPSWAAWNTTIGQLLSGCTLVLYDGSPGYPDLLGNWRVAADARASVFGAGAAYLGACEKAGADLGQLDLSAVRLLITTGSVLAPSTWRWVYRALGPRVRLESSLGSTDMCSGMVGGSPLEPVIVGELNCSYLGQHAQAWNAQGQPVIDEVGELVFTVPVPSMPVAFWSDPDGERYRAAYFDVYPGVWRHGDWVRVTPRGTMVIEGRSDSTLNKAGVRMGSADIYAIVEPLDGVADSLVVGVDLPDAGYYMPLFIVPAKGHELDQELRAAIVGAIRSRLSPRHVPDEIIQAPAVPRTRTGKKLEVPIKRILAGVPVEDAVTLSAVDLPEVVLWYADLAVKRSAQAPD